jgi:hypothetical protein
MDKGEGFLGPGRESWAATSEWQRSVLRDRQPHHRACPCMILGLFHQRVSPRVPANTLRDHWSTSTNSDPSVVRQRAR